MFNWKLQRSLVPQELPPQLFLSDQSELQSFFEWLVLHENPLFITYIFFFQKVVGTQYVFRYTVDSSGVNQILNFG